MNKMMELKRILICIYLLAIIPSIAIAQDKIANKGLPSSKIDPIPNPTGFPKSPTLRPSVFLEEMNQDWSDEANISIPEPQCAYVNIKGTNRLPDFKGDTLHCWMEVYDGDGNYFCKRVILDAQGNSSLMYPKKSMKVDFCDDEWLGDHTPKISIGNWVAQDGFHLIAYYNDYLRGVAVVGYKLYELMVEDVGLPWTRSNGLAKNEPKALCHPDGFPCIVYLDDEFYGVFSWQLKKHRANMAQKKDNPRHIHLDGKISNTTFWNGTIDWNAFDVRNPKEMSEETKECIISLSRVCNDLQQIIVKEQNDEKLRAEFARRFDVQSLLDYACLHYLIANVDGFGKNWQWFTYDGIKWFVAPYNLDLTFGNSVNGETLNPADRTGVDYTWALYTEGPIYWLSVYYKNEIRNRYCQLRRNGIINNVTVKTLVHDWYERIGERNYSEEWNRWSDSKCIHEPEYAWCWKPLDIWKNYHKLSDWNSTTEYKKGDICRLNLCEWEATEDNVGVKPYVSLGYVDSMERLEEWIDRRFELIDSYFGYVDYVGIGKYASNERSTERWTNGKEIIYDIHGNRLNGLVKGVNIIVGEDGKARKVLVK